MKHKFLIVLVAGLLTGLSAAQAQKYGYFDVNYVVPQMPEFKQAESELKVYEKQLQDELQSKRKTFDEKYKALEAGAATMTDPVKESKVKELQTLEQQILEFQQSAQQKYQEKSAQKLEPIYAKLEKTLADFAKEGGYTYIFKKEALLFELPEYNVSDLVLKKLGITPAPTNTNNNR